MPSPAVRILLALCCAGCCRHATAQLTPYNPYADVQEPVAPVAPDGTLQWGTFFKSAALQKSYERLWNQGACRGTNRRITEPVARNALSIDGLPTGEFQGVVRNVGGTLRGGALAFVAGSDPAAEPYLAQLHPAGVSRLTVTGTVAIAAVRPGMTVRFAAEIDAEGRGTEPLRRVDVITLTDDSRPVEVQPGRLGTVCGTVTGLRGGDLAVRIGSGRVRRVRIPVAADAVAVLDAADLSLVAPGDAVEVEGRVWQGEGSAGAGTIFAERLTVTKASAPVPVVAAP